MLYGIRHTASRWQRRGSPPRYRPRAGPTPGRARAALGVLGTGWIAERFVRALQTSTTQQVVAVGSRTQASAERFAAAAGTLTAHGSPEALVADPAVDVV